jgi:hypothetical protein
LVEVAERHKIRQQQPVDLAVVVGVGQTKQEQQGRLDHLYRDIPGEQEREQEQHMAAGVEGEQEL